MPLRKVIAGTAREFTLTLGFSVDIASGDIFAYIYKADSGPTTLATCAIATHSGGGVYRTVLQVPSGSTSVGSWFARWQTKYGTLQCGSDAFYLKTQQFEVVLDNEDG